jgi:hypothetical protein
MDQREDEGERGEWGPGSYALFAEESRVRRAVRVVVTLPRVLRAFAWRSTTAYPNLRNDVRGTLFYLFFSSMVGSLVDIYSTCYCQ